MYWIFALIAVALAIVSSPAQADVSYTYGAVVCAGNNALIRFTSAYNEEPPKFVGSNPDKAQEDPVMLSSPIYRELSLIEPTEPSACTLKDGRVLKLKQADLNDAGGYGCGGGNETEIFSLWIGGKKIYSAEIWSNKCVGGDIKKILLTGNRLMECRQPAGAYDTIGPEKCTDESDRLSRSIPETLAPGKISLVKAAPGQEKFCKSFIKPKVVDSDASSFNNNDPPAVYWATRLKDELEKVDPGKFIESDIFDLNNDGKPDRAVSWSQESGGPNADESVWAILPESATDAEVESLQEKLMFANEAKANVLRKSGIPIFAGDQTTYSMVADVHLNPFIRDGVTWMHAAIVHGTGTVDYPSDLILRPTPAGGLDEICQFRTNPPL